MRKVALVARRYWLYKNNKTQEGPAGYWGDWLGYVFDRNREKQWGGDYSTRSMEVHNYLEVDLRAGDVIAAYQTDDKAVVGFCVITRMTGNATGQVDVQKPDGRMIWLRPIERVAPPLLVHRVKHGTSLEQSPAVNGPVMLRELTSPEMADLVALAGAPKRVLDGKPPRGGYRS